MQVARRELFLTNQGTDDGVCGRDGHGVPRCKGEPQGAANDDTGESKEADTSVVAKDGQVDDAVLDCARNTCTDEDCAEELKDGGAQHGLFECQRARRDRCGPTVRHIVGTYAIRI